MHDLNKMLLNGMLEFCLNVVFNVLMNDKDLIKFLGGATKVSELLGLKKPGGPQRVHNWLSRGIPPRVKLEHPDLFLKSSK